MLDEEKVSIEEEVDVSSEENQMKEDDNAIHNSEELEKEKQVVKELYAENNHAHTQSFIQEAKTVNYYIGELRPVKYELPVEQKYDLKKCKECIAFVKEFKNTEYFFTAFVLAMFQIVEVFDLKELKSIFSDCLPPTNINETEYIGPYVAQDSILSVISGEKYTKNGLQYVGLGDNYEQVLQNFIGQFPDLQEPLICMIEQLLEIKRYRKDFYLIQIALLLKNLHKKRLVDVEERILPYLCRNKVNIEILVLFLCFLYGDEQTENDADRIISDWLKHDRKWMWQVASLVYIQLMETRPECQFEKQLEKIISNKIIGFRKDDYRFISDILMCSKDFRELICRVWNGALPLSNNEKEIPQQFLCLIRNCYYRVNEGNVTLPLIVCDSKQQLFELKEILEKVMGCCELRRQLYSLLKAYIKEIAEYEYSVSVISRVAGYCWFLGAIDDDYREDIIDVLKQCPDVIAKKILEEMNR